MDKYLELCRNQDEVMESLMLTAPMSTLQGIQDSYLESILADMHAEDAEIFGESVQNVRKSHKSRHDKKAARRKGSPKRFRDRSRKCAHEGHMYKVYARGLGGDCNIRGRRLEKTGRPQSVNVHFTDGFRHDTFGMSEEDIDQTWSVDSWDYPNTDMFIEAMESWDWERIPSEVRFQVWWNAENPMANPEDSSPDCFWMKATGNQGRKTVNAEKAHEEFLRFKKEYQIYQKYAKRIGELHRMERDLYRQMREELRSV